LFIYIYIYMNIYLLNTTTYWLAGDLHSRARSQQTLGHSPPAAHWVLASF
jgi:hypothetical protein